MIAELAETGAMLLQLPYRPRGVHPIIACSVCLILVVGPLGLMYVLARKWAEKDEDRP